MEECLLKELQAKPIKTNKSVQRGIKKRKKQNKGAKPRMSLISVVFCYIIWRRQRSAMYLAKIDRRLEKQYQEQQVEGKKRAKGRELRIQM